VSFSVVIPVVDEEARIGLRLRELGTIAGVDDVIVVDGGSTDRTVDIARATPRVRVVSAPRGRGTQLNAGAALARSDVILFLHADVSLPADAARWIDRALAEPGVVAGAFRTWTVIDGEDARWVRHFLWVADVRSRVTRFPYGDQALFVRRDAFRRAGGFPDQPIMEDLELSRRLRRLGTIRTVPAVVRVSGRRFLDRPLRTAALMRALPVLYRLGVPPQRLARLYGRAR